MIQVGYEYLHISCRLDEAKMMLMLSLATESLLKCADAMVKCTLNHQYLFIFFFFRITFFFFYSTNFFIFKKDPSSSYFFFFGKLFEKSKQKK